MISFWEKNSFLNYDVIIIGGGLNGLSIASSIKEKYPRKSVLIIEKGSWPVGASTRNAGFACYGSFSELRADTQNFGLDNTLKLVELRYKGMEMHLRRLGKKNCGYEQSGGGELIFDKENFENEELVQFNQWLHPIFREEVFKENSSKIESFGFNKKGLKTFIDNSTEGQVNIGLMMKNLWHYTAELGVMIMNGLEVIDYSDNGSSCSVYAHHNVIKEQPVFKCETLILATNAFSQKFLPSMDIVPGRGQVLATEPIKGLKLKGNVHFNAGMFYFRNFENRIIFGGGRHLFKEEETTMEMDLNLKIHNTLDSYLQNLIIPGIPYKVEYRWAGIMAFGQDKMPIIEEISPNVIAGVKMGGMGLALSGITGQHIADML